MHIHEVYHYTFITVGNHRFPILIILKLFNFCKINTNKEKKNPVILYLKMCKIKNFINICIIHTRIYYFHHCTHTFARWKNAEIFKHEKWVRLRQTSGKPTFSPQQTQSNRKRICRQPLSTTSGIGTTLVSATGSVSFWNAARMRPYSWGTQPVRYR